MKNLTILALILLMALTACSTSSQANPIEISQATVVLPGGTSAGSNTMGEAAMNNEAMGEDSMVGESMHSMNMVVSLAGFMQIKNNSPEDDRLVAASTDFADAELHEIIMVGDVMKMSPVSGIDIPAHSTVELKSGSYHVMFVNLKKEVKLGDTVNLTLSFENAGDVTISAVVGTRQVIEMKKRSNIFGLILLVVIVIGAIVYTLSSQNRFNGIVYDPPQAMPDFTLDSAHGQVSLSDFHGKVIILFFVYTYCPDICPLALSYLKQSVGDLGNQAEDVQVIFISVDWKRDTPEGLAKYTANFNPDFLGLTGTEDQINQVTQDFGIYYLMNSPNSSGYYSVDHTASIMVLDQQGSHVLTWPNETQPEQMTSDLEKIFKE